MTDRQMIKALENRMNKIDEYIVNNFESKMSIEELARCEDKDFIKACKEYDKCVKTLNQLKGLGLTA